MAATGALGESCNWHSIPPHFHHLQLGSPSDEDRWDANLAAHPTQHPRWPPSGQPPLLERVQDSEAGNLNHATKVECIFLVKKKKVCGNTLTILFPFIQHWLWQHSFWSNLESLQPQENLRRFQWRRSSANWRRRIRSRNWDRCGCKYSRAMWLLWDLWNQTNWL